MVAKKTIANKLTRACYHMLKNNTACWHETTYGCPFKSKVSGALQFD